jgi:AAA domain-containing protein
MSARHVGISSEAASIIGITSKRAVSASGRPGEAASKVKIDEIGSVFSFDSEGIEFAAPDLIACSAITAITGDAGAGKTTFTTKLVASIACGAEFLGRECSKRRVLILDRENSLPIVQERLTRLRVQDGSDLRIWGSWLPEEAPQPGAPMILDWVTAHDPRPVVVIDSLIAFFTGDENSSSDVRPFMQQLRRLADAGAAVIVLHHSGKGETSRAYRGSSDIKAAIDVGYSLMNLEEGRLDRLRLKAFKTRFLVTEDLILHYRDGEFVPDNSPGAIGIALTDQLTKLLWATPGIRSADFESKAASQGLGRDRAREFLRNGIAPKTVRQEIGPKNAKFHYWAGCPEGDHDPLL